MTSLAVTDAHALIWYAQDRPKKLGRAARRMFEAMEEGSALIYVPALVLVEVGEAAAAGRLALPSGFEEWTGRLLSSGRCFAVDLTWEIIRRAERLRAIPERGDRLIAATAAQLGHPLITRDPAIAAASGVEVIW